MKEWGEGDHVHVGLFVLQDHALRMTRQVDGLRDLPIIHSIPPVREQPVKPTATSSSSPNWRNGGCGASGVTKKGGYTASREELHTRFNRIVCNVAAKLSRLENVLGEGGNGLIVGKIILTATSTGGRNAVLSISEQQDNRKTTGWITQSLLRRTN